MNPQWLQKEPAARSRSSPLRKAECRNEPALPIGTSLHFGSSPLHPQGWIFWNCPFLAAPGGGAVAPFFAGVWSFQVLPGYEPRLYSQWFSNAAILSQVSLHFIGMDRILKNPLEKDRPGFVKNKINIAWIRKKKTDETAQWLVSDFTKCVGVGRRKKTFWIWCSVISTCSDSFSERNFTRITGPI